MQPFNKISAKRPHVCTDGSYSVNVSWLFVFKERRSYQSPQDFSVSLITQKGWLEYIELIIDVKVK